MHGIPGCRSAARLVVLTAVGLAAPAHPQQQVFERAAQALATGDLASAERGFRQVLDKQPDHLGALGNLGVVYSRMERLTDAIRVYRQALKLSPNEPGLELNLALAHLKLEDYAAAKPLAARADRSRLASARTRELLATCQLFTGEDTAAVTALETLPRTASVLYLLGAGYLRTGRQDKAEEAFRELLTAAASPAQAQFLLGKAYQDSTLFEEAAAAFRRAVEIDPGLPAARLHLGKTYISLRDHERAEKELRAAAEPEAGYYLGALLVLSGREGEAVPLLERARAARPSGWGAYYYLGRARLQAGEARAAAGLLEQAARLNPTEAAIYYQLARARQASGHAKDAARARAQFEKLKQQSRQDEQAVFANTPR